MPKRMVVGIVTKQCEECGASVTKQASQFRARVFCSRQCYWKSGYHSEAVAAANAKRHPVDSVIIKACEECGTEIRRARSQYRMRAFCGTVCRQSNRSRDSVRQINAGGYAKLFVGQHHPGADSSGHILEHRKVMQDILGRALLPEENVHHKNGVRSDNRPENLELWTRSQPSGQRVADKLRWARELIAIYESTPVT